MFNFHKKKLHETPGAGAMGGMSQQHNSDSAHSMYTASLNKTLYPTSYSNTGKQDSPNMNISPSPLGIIEPTPRRNQDIFTSSLQPETSTPMQPIIMNRKRNSLNDLLNEKPTINSNYNTMAGVSPLLNSNQYLQSNPQQIQASQQMQNNLNSQIRQSQQMQQQNITQNPQFKRIWVKKLSHTATTISVGPNDIVDDLKYMIANKFPTTLAVKYDPSDLVIKLQIPVDSSPTKLMRNNTNGSCDESMYTLHNDTANTSGNNFFINQMPKLKAVHSDESYNQLPISGGSRSHLSNAGLEISRSTTPASPEPLTTARSNFINREQPENQWKNNTRTLILEPDLLVWSVVDRYFPNGMQMSDAFVIDSTESQSDEVSRTDYRPRSTIPLQVQNRNRNDQYDTTTINFPKPSRPTNNSKIAILGDQKVPKPRFKSIVGQENPVPQSAAVILFSKDVHDEKAIPQNEKVSQLPSPSAARDTTQQPPIQLSKLPMRHTSSSDTHKKLDLRVNTTDTGDTLKPPPSDSTLIAAPTPRSDTTLTPKTSESKPIVVKPKIITKTADKKQGLSRILININVLVVEDNLVNQKIMARHLKSCGVQFKIASTGQEALEFWREGGFHLCFMDIQLPVMSGIEVTKEIRRLERLNNIGNMSSYDEKSNTVNAPEDVLDLSLFRSPIIIVALTASSGATDQQNALAAGCNDYLTKPVQLKWLKNKLTEWGYMQALINFDYFKSEK